MSADPPRYSHRHFNWGEPVYPDGSIPLDHLMNWLKINLASFRQAADKDKALIPLCQELNERGSRCTVANIVVELECLTKTAWRSREWIAAATYDEDLFESYFDGKEPDLVRRHRDSHISGPAQAPQPGEQTPNRANSRSVYMRWMDASASGGLSPMAILVSWLPDNIKAFFKADQVGRRRALLKDLCDDMKSAGHAECTESRISHKIYQIRHEVEQELNGNYGGSTCFKNYRDFFMDLFGYEEDDASVDVPRWRSRSVAPGASGVVGDASNASEDQVPTPPVDNAEDGGWTLPSLEELEMRTQIALTRKKLQVAGVSDSDVDVLLPKPARNSSNGDHLSLEQIEVRCQAGLGRKKLNDEGLPDVEVEILLPMPTDSAGVSSDYPLNLDKIGRLVKLGIGRLDLRRADICEGEIDESLSLPVSK